MTRKWFSARAITSAQPIRARRAEPRRCGRERGGDRAEPDRGREAGRRQWAEGVADGHRGGPRAWIDALEEEDQCRGDRRPEAGRAHHAPPARLHGDHQSADERHDGEDAGDDHDHVDQPAGTALSPGRRARPRSQRALDPTATARTEARAAPRAATTMRRTSEGERTTGQVSMTAPAGPGIAPGGRVPTERAVAGSGGGDERPRERAPSGATNPRRVGTLNSVPRRQWRSGASRLVVGWLRIASSLSPATTPIATAWVKYHGERGVVAGGVRVGRPVAAVEPGDQAAEEAQRPLLAGPPHEGDGGVEVGLVGPLGLGERAGDDAGDRHVRGGRRAHDASMDGTRPPEARSFHANWCERRGSHDAGRDRP